MNHERVETKATVINNLCAHVSPAYCEEKQIRTHTVVAFSVKVRLVENMVKSHDGSVEVMKAIVQ